MVSNRAGVVDGLSPTDVAVLVRGVSLAELLGAIVAGSDIEAEAWAGYRQSFGPLCWRCPRCQPPEQGTTLQLLARFVDSVRWVCEGCGSSGTRYEVEEVLLRDPRALERLAT